VPDAPYYDLYIVFFDWVRSEELIDKGRSGCESGVTLRYANRLWDSFAAARKFKSTSVIIRTALPAKHGMADWLTILLAAPVWG
jgi:hypothetical protein